MASHRIDRTTEDIKRELTAILRELKDPRVQETMLSVVRVEVTNDPVSYTHLAEVWRSKSRLLRILPDW